MYISSLNEIKTEELINQKKRDSKNKIRKNRSIFFPATRSNYDDNS